MRNKNLVGYFFIIGTAFFTAFSYIFGKKVSDELFPETVAFYWFLGAFLVAILKRVIFTGLGFCLLYTSPSPRDGLLSRMPSSA